MWRERGRLVDAGLAALAIGITLSTMLVKQHILIDAVAGVVWGFGAFWLSTKLYARLTDARATPRQGLAQLVEPRRWRRLAWR
jgi:membrane-associated phospholipid phosphatase